MRTGVSGSPRQLSAREPMSTASQPRAGDTAVASARASSPGDGQAAAVRGTCGPGRGERLREPANP
ncbi:hypothetical protein [Embleya sp. NPDC005971]|uniref:hypothetical protein n=1 Tax=Embleya sp. NPDC005971 TaxID=3156724 RepID=UPI0033F26B88